MLPIPFEARYDPYPICVSGRFLDDSDPFRCVDSDSEELEGNEDPINDV